MNRSLPRQPLLRFGDLAVFSRPAAAHFPFTAPRQRSFAFARNALAAALRALRLGPRDEVLLPAFHCVTVVEPVLHVGAACRFYNITRDLGVDWTSLCAAVSERTRAILVIHFLGFPEPRLADVVALCRDRGIYLIEDCTHALFSAPAGVPLGREGHLSLFSFRKTLPVLGGALLVANDDATPLPDPARPAPWAYSLRAIKAMRDLRTARPPADDVAGTPPSAPARDVPAATGEAPTGGTDGWLYGYDFNPDLDNRRGSRAVLSLAVRFDPARIRRRRRTNFCRLAGALSSLRGVRMPLGSPPDGACPWAFALDGLGRNGLDKSLRRIGVPAFTFGEVLHRALPRGAYPDAEYLSRNLILLPVHQSLSEVEIARIAKAVRHTVEAT